MTIEEACWESRHASEILPIAEMAKKSEAVLHELQKERGRTAVLIASEYAVEPQGLLQEQRAATDEVVEQLVSGPSVDQVATEMADGIEGYLEEMTRDVEERCRASRKQEMGQQVKLVTQDGKSFETRLMNSSEGGIGVMYFDGTRVGQLVTYEDFSGRKFPMEVKWVRGDTVGLQYRAEAGSMADAA